MRRSSLWKSLLLGLIFFVIVLASFNVSAIGIENPISANSFQALIERLADAILKIAIPLAVVAIIFVGFKFVLASASGNAKGLEEARKMFLWLVAGTALIVGSSALAKAVVNFAKDL